MARQVALRLRAGGELTRVQAEEQEQLLPRRSKPASSDSFVPHRGPPPRDASCA